MGVIMELFRWLDGTQKNKENLINKYVHMYKTRKTTQIQFLRIYICSQIENIIQKLGGDPMTSHLGSTFSVRLFAGTGNAAQGD